MRPRKPDLAAMSAAAGPALAAACTLAGDALSAPPLLAEGPVSLRTVSIGSR